MEKTMQKNGDSVKALAPIDKRRKMLNRKLKRISILPEMFLNLMIPGRWKWATDGIPSDTQYFGMTFDAPSGTWQIFITHDSFEEVPEGSIIPQAVVNFKTEPVIEEDVEPVQ